MAHNVREIRCRPDEVFAVLADGWLYPAWVVGASRMRAVDESWPAPGARLHHSVGTWPLLLDDSTVVEEWDRPRRVVLTARGWPIGAARVEIEAKADAETTRVRIVEEAVSGPATWLPRWFTGALLRWRNAETLRRLAYLAEGRAGTES